MVSRIYQERPQNSCYSNDFEFREGQEMKYERFWGIYFPPDSAWLKRPSGELCFYPSPYIAQAHLNELQKWGGYKMGTVKEFDESLSEGPLLKPKEQK